MEIENVNGKANAGLTTGIIGTALSVLGGLGGLAMNNSALNGNSNYVTKDEMKMVQDLAAKDSQIALLTSEQNTEVKIADVYERIMTRVNSDQRAQADWNASQSVANAQMAAGIAANATSIAALQGITKLVVPNTSVCPGWGNVTITPATSTTATTTSSTSS